MHHIYLDIINAIKAKKKLLAVLIDPDKVNATSLPVFFDKVHQSVITHVFIGGSTDEHRKTETIVKTVKQLTNLPVVLFPGSFEQITNKADAILFLSLISGRNPDYLIEHHVKSVSKLKNATLAIIPTGYILIDGGKKTSVEKVSNTHPISQKNIQLITDTAIAGSFMGKKLIYLEAGSGAKEVVSEDIISNVRKSISIPLIVGGGIRSKEQLQKAYNAGADMVVIGTAFEQNESFFNQLKK